MTMKISTIIIQLTIMVLFFCCSAFAQNDDDIKQGKRIQTGFVFVNSKYIKAPYKVKRKGFAIYINGLQVTKELELDTPNISYRQRLGIPTCLNKNSSLSDYIKCKEPDQGLPYLTAMFYYYFGKYEYNQAYDSMLTYYRSMPNVKHITVIDESFIEVTSYSNETRKELFAFNMKKYNQKWGPNGTGPTSKEVMKKKVDRRCRIIGEDLLSNQLIIFDTENYKQLNLSQNKELEYFYAIIQNNNYTVVQKTDSLKLLGDSTLFKKFIEKYQPSASFDKGIIINQKILDREYRKSERQERAKSIQQSNKDDIYN